MLGRLRCCSRHDACGLRLWATVLLVWVFCVCEVIFMYSMASVEQILEEWNLAQLIPLFEENCIDMEVFMCLSQHELDQLFRNKVGLRNKFCKMYGEYIKEKDPSKCASQEEPLNNILQEAIILYEEAAQPSKQETDDLLTARQDSSSQKPVEQTLSLDIELEVLNGAKKTTVTSLDDILQSCLGGKMILSLSSAKKKLSLDEKQRSILVEAIIYRLMNQSPSQKIPYETFDRLADQIIQLFPNEKKPIYYIPPAPNVLAKGKLIDKYHNTRRELIHTGVISSTRRRKSQSDDEEPSELQTPLPDVLQNDLAWLEVCTEPRHTVEEKWEHTSAHRVNLLREKEKPVSKKAKRKPKLLLSDYMNLYPCLQKSWGYTLLEKDFDYLYPNKSVKLISEWPQFSEKVKGVLAKRKKNNDGDEDQVDGPVDILLNFSKIFTPHIVRGEGKKTWKPSHAEMQEGFLMHCKVIGDIPTRIERRTQKVSALGLRLQPSAIVVGSDSSNIAASYVVFDNIRYDVESPLRAVDVCFKIYQALHANYPPESQLMWQVLQVAVYGIHTEWDDSTPGLHRLLVDLS